MPEERDAEIKNLQMIEQALTIARIKAKGVDSAMLAYFLRLAYRETTDMLKKFEDADKPEDMDLSKSG